MAETDVLCIAKTVAIKYAENRHTLQPETLAIRYAENHKPFVQVCQKQASFIATNLGYKR
jgi:hypothetical protein